MTAIVGILNRRGAVLAADSAVTVENGARRKIYNTATKIFRLTDGPVGVMIFSSSEVNGMPWDVIFKLFRERYGKQTFPSLMDYVRNFINFLKSENCFSTEKTQMDYFEAEVRRLYSRLATAINDKLPDESEPKDAEIDDVAFNEIINNTIKEFEEHFDEVGVCSEMENYTIDQMRMYASELFDSMAEQYEDDGFGKDFAGACGNAGQQSAGNAYGLGQRLVGGVQRQHEEMLTVVAIAQLAAKPGGGIRSFSDFLGEVRVLRRFVGDPD